MSRRDPDLEEEPICSSSQAGKWACPTLTLGGFLSIARATLEILIPDFVKQTSEEKPKDSEELEVSPVGLDCSLLASLSVP